MLDDALLYRTEDRRAIRTNHVDTHVIAELKERRLRFAQFQSLDHAPLRPRTEQQRASGPAHVALRFRNIAVRSNLLSLGRSEGGAATVLEALRNVAGKDATIAVPTYTLNLGSDTPYDLERTPSYAAGVFSEYVRQLPASRRSSSPMHSHAAIGPLAGLGPLHEFFSPGG